MKLRFSRFAPLLTFAVLLGHTDAANAGPIWSSGAETTYVQSEWCCDAGSTTAKELLEANFNSVYAASFGELHVGGIFRMNFDSANAIEAYLPQPGPVGVLDATLDDPTTSASGTFGGEVVTLELNVDFSDAGLLSASSGIPFGDLLLTGFGNALDGLSVRSLLGDAETCLGAGACLLTIDDMNSIAAQLDSSFLDGTPDDFAQLHLVTPSTVSVPEPITLSLFGVGLAGLAAMRRRKKKPA